MPARSYILSEEQRCFINDRALNGLSYDRIQNEFFEKYDRMPTKTTITRYMRYHEWGRDIKKEDKEETEKEEPEEELEEGVIETPKKEKEIEKLEVDAKDTRKQKSNVITFSKDGIDEADFARIVKAVGRSESDTWKFLKKCIRRGYTRINLQTGEVE